MKVSKTFIKAGKTYLKRFQGKSSTWTDDKKKAINFISEKEAEELAELHGAKIEK